jgi:tripartite-type tricarboxylate transporter receptor subunit TctC
MNRLAIIGLVTAFTSLAAGQAHAQAARPAGAGNYPANPVRFIVPFAPGSGNDLVARKVGQLLSESLKQTFIMENQGGAGGMIGITQLTRATPNGYTIAMGSTSTLAIGPYMMKEPPYDPVRDVAPVTLIAAAPFLLVVSNKLPVNSVSELIAYAKANPGKLNFGSAGIGTTNHLGVEVLGSLAGISLTHVPFKGAAPANAAVIASEIEMTFGPILTTVPQVKQRQLKAIAVTGAQRASVMPDLPTVAESGFPGYQSVNWYGIVAPAKTPAPILDLLNREIVRHLATPEFRNQLTSDGAQVYGNSPKEFADIIRAETESYRKVIKSLNLTTQ